MWPFKKKQKKEEAAADSGEEEEEGGEKKPAVDENSDAKTQIRQMSIELTKISATLEAFKGVNKGNAERFSTINEQMGELRGQLMDTNKTIGTLEVKTTKAVDLVESVQPDKLMIQVQKEDGKIEGLRGMLEAKDEMLKNVMEQMRKLRDEMKLFQGVNQVVKLNEEVKDEIMNVKKLTAVVERHADRVENVFVESQKSFEEFHRFQSSIDSIKSELKETGGKISKIEAKLPTLVVKKDFAEKIDKLEKSDKHMTKLSKAIEKSYKNLDDRFEQLRGELKGDFDRRLFKADLMSRSFEDLLRENPLFAKGLDLNKFLEKHVDQAKEDMKEMDKKADAAEAEKAEGAQGEEKEGEEKEGEEEAGEGEKTEEGAAEGEATEEKKDS